MCLRDKLLDISKRSPYICLMADPRITDPNTVKPEALHERAMDNIRYIRETMERASSFTGVPGWGGVAMGVTALAAAWLAHVQGTSAAWLTAWLVEALGAGLIGAFAMAYKSKASKTPVLSVPSRKFLLGFTPPLIAGAVLTPVLYRHNLHPLLPGVWLLLYGSRCGNRRSLLHQDRPSHGVQFHGPRHRGAFQPPRLG